jgi:signal transduction histidine kinase/CheY-like chemotaxis protein
MSIWRKRTEKESSGRGVARAALDGASREELVREAQKSLAKEGRTGRIGVWLEPDPDATPQKEAPAGFRGMVLDRGSDETPPEWATLSVEPPLPEELLLRGKTVEQDLDAFPANPITGVLVGLRHALWVPIERHEQLRGVILVGSLEDQPSIFRQSVESVAAELSLALGLEEEQRIARHGNTDLGVVKRFLRTPTSEHSPDTLLRNLVESCTATAAGAESPGATFAAIGALRHPREPSGENFSLEFLWHSGDAFWTRAIQSEPLVGLWRQALQERRVIGSASEMGWTRGTVDRIVAFPLQSEGQLSGAMVAGLPGRATSLATFERLELRAVLAASALRHRMLKEEESRRAGRQQTLLECISEPLLVLDEAGRIAAASRGAHELALGTASKIKGPRRPETPSSSNLEEVFRAGDREQVETWLRAALDRGPANRDVNAESIRVELHNGAGVRLRLVKPAQGAATVILLESLVAGASNGQAMHAETELQNVIEWLEEGVVLFDTQNNIRAINTRFEQMAGLAPEESGKFQTLEGLIGRLERHAGDPARFTQRWRELARNIEGGIREEVQMAHPSPRILERSARPVLDPLGRLLGRVEIYRDLTAQRAFQSKLLQTEKLAALGQMVSGIAHELSNPLTIIAGYAHRLLARPDAPGRTEEVRQIYQEAERAGTILRQLLLNARETLPERRLVSLNQIVQRAIELRRFTLAAEKIRVEIDLDPALPFVEGDPGQLQQVLMNLVGNAQQALEHQGQGGAIKLSTRTIGERRVLLEIKDNGPGIPQAILARIFDPFFTTKPAGVGTGLGLSIVLSVVREHGGQVHVITPPMGGAVFQIELPAASGALLEEAPGSPLPERRKLLPDAVPAADRENRYAATARETGKGARVLVVEDEPTVARLIADVLEDEGMQVEVLLDGREALQRAARQTFDLVICDMKMPGLDGQHFYKFLKRSGNPLRERFLFVTGDIVAAQTREFLERNRVPHVAKPFLVEELTEKVRGVLKLQARTQPRAAEGAKKNAARNG